MIVSMRASNNNSAETVLSVFMHGASFHGVPSRVRGDHGTENLRVAAYMNDFRGADRGSYLWGR